MLSFMVILITIKSSKVFLAKKTSTDIVPGRLGIGIYCTAVKLRRIIDYQEKIGFNVQQFK